MNIGIKVGGGVIDLSRVGGSSVRDCVNKVTNRFVCIAA